MCEFCKEHGEGKKWYLNIKNYSFDLVSDLQRRKFISHFNEEIIGKGAKRISQLERISKNKKIPPLITKPFVEQSKKVHYGQVVPIEDVQEILRMTINIVRLACSCRYANSKKEERCCYGIALNDSRWFQLLDMDFFGSPEMSKFETLTAEQALQQIKKFEEKRLIHTIWTFGTPFIGGLCNCDLENCLGMRTTFKMNMPLLFRAEYIAGINEGQCSGCRQCIDQCPVKAIDFVESKNACVVNKEKCYGCGVCRCACEQSAIVLTDRNKDSLASNLW